LIKLAFLVVTLDNTTRFGEEKKKKEASSSKVAFGEQLREGSMNLVGKV